MHFISSLLLLLLLASCFSSLAAPPSTRLESPAVTTNSSLIPSTRTSSRSHHHSLAIPTRPTFLPGDSGPGHFTPHRNPTVLPSPSTTDGRHRQTEAIQHISIFFEVVGGLVGLTILFSCIRCCYVYKKTPARDRIAAVLHRHQLDQELAEIERNGSRNLAHSPTSDPLPLYCPPPPTYETVALIRSPDTSSGLAQHSGYIEVATSSPPHSPRSTLQAEVVEFPSRPHTPPISNG